MIRLTPIPLGCLHWACRERRGILSRGCLAKVIVHWYRNIFSHVPCGHAQGDPRQRGPRGSTVNSRSTSPPQGGAHIAGAAWSTKRYLSIELLKDQQMRRVSQGRMPLSQPKVRKMLDTTRANFAFRPACGTYL